MNFKEFYSFSWTKLVITLIILILPAIYLFQEAAIKDGHGLSYVIPITVIFFWPFLLMLTIEQFFLGYVDLIHVQDVPFLLIALIINVVYVYSMVCGIVALVKIVISASKRTFP